MDIYLILVVFEEFVGNNSVLFVYDWWDLVILNLLFFNIICFDNSKINVEFLIWVCKKFDVNVYVWWEYIFFESIILFKVKKISIVNVLNVFVMIMFFFNVVIILNNVEVIWFMSMSRIYCLNNLKVIKKYLFLLIFE